MGACWWRRPAGRGSEPGVAAPAAVVHDRDDAEDLRLRARSPASRQGDEPRRVGAIAAVCRAGSRRAPVVLWVHGGGYQVGDSERRRREGPALQRPRLGLRLGELPADARRGDPSSAHFPDHFRDVAAAIAWTRAHVSAFGGDPRRLAVLGHSGRRGHRLQRDHGPAVAGGARAAAARRPLRGPARHGGVRQDAGAGRQPREREWRVALGPRRTTRPRRRRRCWPGRGRASRRRSPSSAASRCAARSRRPSPPRSPGRRAGDGHRRAVADAGQVDRRIGAPGDTVMTPPLMRFLRGCFQRR